MKDRKSYTSLAERAAYNLKCDLPSCYQIMIDRTHGKLNKQYREYIEWFSLFLITWFYTHIL